MVPSELTSTIKSEEELAFVVFNTPKDNDKLLQLIVFIEEIWKLIPTVLVIKMFPPADEPE